MKYFPPILVPAQEIQKIAPNNGTTILADIIRKFSIIFFFLLYV